MTKTFKNLNSIYEFHTGECHGEIVSISLTFTDQGWLVPNQRLTWKCKNRAFSAATNAYFMHRGLCKELRGISWFVNLTSSRQRILKKMLFAAIFEAYRQNADTNFQGFGIVINLANPRSAAKALGLISNENYVEIESWDGETYGIDTYILDDEGDLVYTHRDGVPVDKE